MTADDRLRDLEQREAHGRELRERFGLHSDDTAQKIRDGMNSPVGSTVTIVLVAALLVLFVIYLILG